MSLTGLFLVVFLLLHLTLNLTALFSKEAYNEVCEFMNTNILITVMVPVLALGFVLHILFSIIITLKNRSARPVRYAAGNKTQASSWASRNMFVLGLIVVCFIGLHLYHFWAKMQLQEFLGASGAEDPYQLVQELFSHWYYALLYVVWIAALYFHISHGFCSAFQTLGASNSKWIPRLQCIAKIYAIIVALGFVTIPIYFLLGLN
jgi:succinate dehydrogenase / fumarate reductase cytochrome b subunit